MSDESSETPEQSAADAAEVDRLLAEHESLKAANQGLLRDLAAAGAQIDPMAVFQQRLELLMEAFAPDGTKERLQLEVVFEQRCHDMVSRALTEVTRAKLTAPPQNNLHELFGSNGKQGPARGGPPLFRPGG